MSAALARIATIQAGASRNAHTHTQIQVLSFIRVFSGGVGKKIPKN